jgi:hypothetical protein
MNSDLEQLVILQVGVVQLFVFLEAPLQLLVLDREVVNDTTEVITAFAIGASAHHVASYRQRLSSIKANVLAMALCLAIGRAFGG